MGRALSILNFEELREELGIEPEIEIEFVEVDPVTRRLVLVCRSDHFVGDEENMGEGFEPPCWPIGALRDRFPLRRAQRAQEAAQAGDSAPYGARDGEAFLRYGETLVYEDTTTRGSIDSWGSPDAQPWADVAAAVAAVNSCPTRGCGLVNGHDGLHRVHEGIAAGWGDVTAVDDEQIVEAFKARHGLTRSDAAEPDRRRPWVRQECSIPACVLSFGHVTAHETQSGMQFTITAEGSRWLVESCDGGDLPLPDADRDSRLARLIEESEGFGL